MAWTLVATDLQGVVLGQVKNPNERKLVLSHLRQGALTFNVPLWDNMADTLLNQDCLIKAYRTDPVTNARTLAFNGPVVTAEESAEALSQHVAVTAADPTWRLLSRVVPGSLLRSTIQYGTDIAPIDLGLIAHNILDEVNAGPSGITSAAAYTGISKGTRTASSNGWYKIPNNKSAAEALAELHASINSFEFQIQPTEPTNVGFSFPQIALLNIAPLIGSNRPDAVFEYGTNRANVGSYSRGVDRTGMMTRGYVSLPGWPDGTTQSQRTVEDATAIGARGLFEAMVPDNGVSADDLRDKIGNFHLAIRKDPKQTILFKPTLNARPAPLIDYNVGDTVRARAVVRGSVRFDASFRIWGITFDVDPNGNESIELELVTP